VADRTDRTLERWRTHLFGFKDDKNDKGRLGRLEADMDEHTVTLKEHSARHEKHDRALDRLDRIGFKILVTTGIGAGCAMAIIEIAIRVIGGSH
jgi:hypothetical protein